MDGRNIMFNKLFYEKNLSIGVACSVGKKRQFEDAYIFETRGSVSIFAVMDGHRGKECVQYVKSNLLDMLFEIIPENEQCDDDDLTRCIRNLDYHCLSFESGSTLACCILQRNIELPDEEDRIDLYKILNVGDSRTTVFDRKNNILMTTEDHKPENEIERIEESGKKVTKSSSDVYRVDGDLAMSRSLGDRSLKYGYGGTISKKEWKKKWRSGPVIADPYIYEERFKAKSRVCVCLYTDGIVDGYKDSEEVIRSQLDIDERPDKVALRVLEGALRKSNDNCTMMVAKINFGNGETDRLKVSQKKKFNISAEEHARAFGISLGCFLMMAAGNREFILSEEGTWTNFSIVLQKIGEMLQIYDESLVEHILSIIHGYRHSPGNGKREQYLSSLRTELMGNKNGDNFVEMIKEMERK